MLIRSIMHNKTELLSLSLLIIIGCGGGGGGSSNVNNASAVSVPPTPPPTPTSKSLMKLKAEYEGHYEYSKSMGIIYYSMHASAYARGATGKAGITIGITDSGLDDSHSEIDASRLSSDSALSYLDYTPNTRQQRHGTMVTSVAAGTLRKVATTPMHGVAFDADVLFVAIQLAEPDPDYDQWI